MKTSFRQFFSLHSFPAPVFIAVAIALTIVSGATTARAQNVSGHVFETQLASSSTRIHLANYPDVKNWLPILSGEEGVPERRRMYARLYKDGSQIISGGSPWTIFVTYEDETELLRADLDLCFIAYMDIEDNCYNNDGEYILEIFDGTDEYVGFTKWWISGNSILESYPYNDVSSTTTRFISTKPYSGETVASTTSLIGAYLYISPDDYVEGMHLSMSFTSRTLAASGGSVLDAFNSATGRGLEINVPLVSGYNNIYTSTDFLTYGIHDGTYRIQATTTLSSLPFVGIYFSPNVLLATTTEFLVVEKTHTDAITEQLTGEIFATNASSTYSGPMVLNCDIGSFSLVQCLTSIFFPSKALISSLINTIEVPYLTRFVTILKTTDASPLPTISYTFSEDSVFSGMNFHFDPWQYMYTDGSVLKDQMVSDREDSKNIWEIFETPFTIAVYLGLLFLVINRLTGIFGVTMSETSTATSKGRIRRVSTSRRINL